MKQFIKQAFRKKKGKTLLIVEFVLAYLVIFSLAIFTIKSVKNYFRPVGFKYDNFLDVGAEIFENGDTTITYDEKLMLVEQIASMLKSQKEVEGISLIRDFVPFTQIRKETEILSENNKAKAFVWTTDDAFMKLLDLHLDKGRWFNKQDNASKLPPVILNSELEQHLFAGKNSLGQTVEINETEYWVIGVVRDFYPSNSKNHKGFFIRNTSGTAGFNPFVSMLVKLNTTPNIRTIVQYHEQISEILKNQTSQKSYINSLKEMRKRQWSDDLFFISSASIIVVFLLVNLLLGLISVLRLTINKRREEIGIRRAVGASKQRIYKLILSETYAITTIGFVIALVLVMQCYLFNVFHTESIHYGSAVLISIAILYILTGLFSLIPATQATKIEPVNALHEE